MRPHPFNELLHAAVEASEAVDAFDLHSEDPASVLEWERLVAVEDGAEDALADFFRQEGSAACEVVRATINSLTPAAKLLWPSDALFQPDDLVRKKGRASWRGKVVGWYRTELTALGFAVESVFEPGSVQIYPQTALEPWDGEA